jgi:hypothetical protein
VQPQSDLCKASEGDSTVIAALVVEVDCAFFRFIDSMPGDLS